jgi:hypothetical protein
MNTAIKTNELGRIYKIRGGKKEEPKELTALENVNVEIQPGELFGLLGPNVFVFRYCDHRARELGYIDRATNY